MTRDLPLTCWCVCTRNEICSPGVQEIENHHNYRNHNATDAVTVTFYHAVALEQDTDCLTDEYSAY